MLSAIDFEPMMSASALGKAEIVNCVSGSTNCAEALSFVHACVVKFVSRFGFDSLPVHGTSQLVPKQCFGGLRDSGNVCMFWRHCVLYLRKDSASGTYAYF